MGAAESSWHGRWALVWGAGASLNFGAVGPGSFPAAPTSPTPLQLQVLPLPMDPSVLSPTPRLVPRYFMFGLMNVSLPLASTGRMLRPSPFPEVLSPGLTVIPAGARMCLGRSERLHRVTIPGPRLVAGSTLLLLIYTTGGWPRSEPRAEGHWESHSLTSVCTVGAHSHLMDRPPRAPSDAFLMAKRLKG